MKFLVVDDETGARYGARRLLESAGHQVVEAASGEEMLALSPAKPFDAILLDYQMDPMDGLTALTTLATRSGAPPVVFFTAQGSERIAVEAMRKGATDYLTKPADADELVMVLERAATLGRERTTLDLLQRETDSSRPSRELLGESPAMRAMREDLALMAPTASSVLLLGESGTGKEMIARFLHERSGRTGPFVAVNCGALPTTLVEAELFGHEKGAFTGATSARPGRIRQAHQGTLFLDEIGDMPWEAQVRLLRVLEERIVEPLGSERTIEVDIRVVAATHRDLQALVAEGRFRQDLLYRLDVLSVKIPPLRERPGDALVLAKQFLRHYAGNRPLEFSPAAQSAIDRAQWAGNVRELRNAIERSCVLVRGKQITPELLGVGPERAQPQISNTLEETPGWLGISPVSVELPFREAKQQVMEEFERKFINHHLEQCGGNISKAALALDMHRQSLQQKMKDLGMTRPDAE
ncbi:MAG: sigma-54-dependent Fis family transcriptional regulator [Fibrobacterota bacterium]|nr:sigma-54-dependent Fis family transcriptional regulator [Fibrobacterota bacterium]QQS06682.1 MAG: sigma-54-dependent Fis family transcriptional regulator [Fibrobacterota bacterium]